MIKKLNDTEFTNTISSNQTQKLFRTLVERFPDDGKITILEKVVLMTPETIHLNSFMYEPIIDLSDKHPRNLYSGLKSI